MRSAHKLAKHARQDAFIRQSKRYNDKHRPAPFSVGDYVLKIRDKPFEYGKSIKLQNAWEGPFLITFMPGPHNCRLRDKFGNDLAGVFNVSKLIPYFKPSSRPYASGGEKHTHTDLERSQDSKTSSQNSRNSTPIIDTNVSSKPQSSVVTNRRLPAFRDTLQALKNQMDAYVEDRKFTPKIRDSLKKTLTEILTASNSVFIRSDRRKREFKEELANIRTTKQFMNYLLYLLVHFDEVFKYEMTRRR
jgi:hypothetical protein